MIMKTMHWTVSHPHAEHGCALYSLLRCRNPTGAEIIECKVRTYDAGLPEDTELAGFNLLCDGAVRSCS